MTDAQLKTLNLKLFADAARAAGFDPALGVLEVQRQHNATRGKYIDQFGARLVECCERCVRLGFAS